MLNSGEKWKKAKKDKKPRKQSVVTHLYRQDQFIHEWSSCFYAKECGECCIVRTARSERAVYLSLSADFLRFFWNHSLFLHRPTCKSRVKVQIESAFVNVQHVWKLEKKNSRIKRRNGKKEKREKRKESLHNVFRIRSDRTQGFNGVSLVLKERQDRTLHENDESVIAKANLSSSFGVSVDYSTTKRFGGRFFSGSCKKEKL